MATTTQQKEQKQQLPLAEEAQATLRKLEAKDPGLKQLLKKAYAYAIFPTVGKAGLVVGGSYGRGVVYERGKLVGYATIGQTTIGVQVGGITYTELLAFENRQAFDRFKQGGLKFAAGAAAVLVKAGAAGQADYEKGVIALAYSRGGMLLEAAIGGQKFTFKPKDGKQDKASGGGGKASRQQDEDQDEGDESSDEGDESESNGVMGLAGRAMSGVRGAASGVGDLVKRHPWASAAVGTTLVAGTILAVRALRNAGGASGSSGEDEDESDAVQDEDEGSEDQSEDEGDESSEGDDEGAESSRDEEDDSDSGDEDESDEQEKQSPRRGGRSRSRA
jgi:lipid-binding SYLF domain-containing protein